MRTWAAIVVLLLAGCSIGEDEAARPRLEPEPATTGSVRTAPDVEAYRSAAAAAVDEDAACAAEGCSADELARRAATVLTAVTPLDDALAGTAVSKGALEPVATAASSLRHAAQELQSCLMLSAEQHGGEADVAECQGPAQRFDAGLEHARAALG